MLLTVELVSVCLTFIFIDLVCKSMKNVYSVPCLHIVFQFLKQLITLLKECIEALGGGFLWLNTQWNIIGLAKACFHISFRKKKDRS